MYINNLNKINRINLNLLSMISIKILIGEIEWFSFFLQNIHLSKA